LKVINMVGRNMKTPLPATISDELMLLKLARTTLTFNFVNDDVRSAVHRMLCMYVELWGTSMPAKSEVYRLLDVDERAEIDMDDERKRCAALIKKPYKKKRGFFAPKVVYNYLLIAEIIYIHILTSGKYEDECIPIFKSFGIKDRDGGIFAEYAACILEDNLDKLVSLTKAVKLKSFSETVLPLSEFIRREKEYYKLPRRNVSVFATMSAGKSSFINALLGYDYLPARNEATTAKITAISDNDYLDHAVGYAVRKGQRAFCAHITTDILEEWNNDDDVSEINIEGDLDGVSAASEVFTIHDTPGINYSGNAQHKKITIEHLRNSKPDIVICLLDATQMQTTDFSDALRSLKMLLDSGQQFDTLFVVNKADAVDPEKENLAAMLADAQESLEKSGFVKPVILPVSSKAARLFKMALKGVTEFTQKEKNDFALFMSLFHDNGENYNKLAIGFSGDIVEYDAVKEDDRILTIGTRTYNALNIQKSLAHTGIPVVEQYLNAYTGGVK